MRKITQEAAHAFKEGKDFSKSNTIVKCGAMFLHGNKIADEINGTIIFSLAGWPTPTTRERLKGIGVVIRQIAGRQYLCGKKDKLIDPSKWYDTNGNEV